MAQNLVENALNCPMENARPTDHFSPSLWGDQFMNFTPDIKLKEIYSKAIEVLKDEVKMMITASGSQMVDAMNLIEILERLGISYHFENEIKEKLEFFFNLKTNYEDEAYDLYTVSLHFRLFRQHGYHITSDIFNKFKSDDGKFKETLKSDARGLLSLFEASHTKIHGESILEDALVFAEDNLKSIAPNLSSPLRKKVEHALVQQLHFGIPRIEAHNFISIYEEDESRNDLLLKLAKLDYNALQMLHKQEMCEISRWWKRMDLASKLPYARDRLVEAYFWSLGVYYEPQYSRARTILAKCITMASLVDDTYDAYGKIEELDVFTQAIQRWDAGEIEGLPEYMRPLYQEILNFYEQLNEELAKEERCYAVHYAKNLFKELVRSYYIEAKWFVEGYLPSFAEYKSNALITSTYCSNTAASLLGIRSATKQEFEWLTRKPKMLVASMEICRFIDDVATYEIEKERGQLATGIECYMKESGVTKEEATNKFIEMITNAWKDMNEESLKPFPCSKNVLNIIFNLTRVLNVTYKNKQDGYTEPEKVLKPHIIALLVNSFKV